MELRSISTLVDLFGQKLLLQDFASNRSCRFFMTLLEALPYSLALSILQGLYVKGLQEDVTDRSLREMFEPFGRVLSATAPADSSHLAALIMSRFDKISLG